MEIPNLRKKEVRDIYREDTMCVDRNVAGEQTIPSFSKGNLEIADKVYEVVRQKWLDRPSGKGK